MRECVESASERSRVQCLHCGVGAVTMHVPLIEHAQTVNKMAPSLHGPSNQMRTRAYKNTIVSWKCTYKNLMVIQWNLDYPDLVYLAPRLSGHA